MPVAFKDPMIHGSAIHIAYRILAAFFIDMGAKTSIVENFLFLVVVFVVMNLVIYLLFCLFGRYRRKVHKVCF